MAEYQHTDDDGDRLDITEATLSITETADADPAVGGLVSRGSRSVSVRLPTDPEDVYKLITAILDATNTEILEDGFSTQRWNVGEL